MLKYIFYLYEQVKHLVSENIKANVAGVASVSVLFKTELVTCNTFFFAFSLID